MNKKITLGEIRLKKYINGGVTYINENATLVVSMVFGTLVFYVIYKDVEYAFDFHKTTNGYMFESKDGSRYFEHLQLEELKEKMEAYLMTAHEDKNKVA